MIFTGNKRQITVESDIKILDHNCEIVRGFEFDVHVNVHCLCYLLGTTNKMQRYTIYFITVNALHISGGFSEKPPEICRALTIIKYIVKRCILLVVPKRMDLNIWAYYSVRTIT
jgi:hypothetical protein